MVTGGGSGLGRAICGDFAACGAHVLVADVDVAAARATVSAITGVGGSAEAVPLDVTDAPCVDEVVAGASRRWGEAFDCLVNNAGTDRGSDLPGVLDEQWRAVFAVNVDGPMHCARAFVRCHLDRSSPWPADVVNIGSISAVTVGAGAGAYNASKAALLKLTEVMQCEAREYGWPVRVTMVQPAAMATPMMDQWSLPPERMMDPAIVASVVRTAVTLPAEAVMSSVTVTLRNEWFPR